MSAKKTTALKGIAIILMLIHHLFTWGQADYTSISLVLLPNGYTIEEFWGIFGKICVTMYLFLSGYGYACKYNNNNQKIVEVNQSIKSIWKVYRKYLIVLLIFLPYGFFCKIYTFDVKEFLGNILAYHTTYNAECWFLFIYILIIAIIMPMLVKCQKKQTNWTVLVRSLFVIVLGYAMRFVVTHSQFAWFRETQLFFNIYYFMLSQFAFVLGWLCKKALFFEKIVSVNINGFIYLLIFMIAVIVKVYCPGGMLIDSILTPILVSVFLKMFDLCCLLERFFSFLGRRSTYMWMTHTFFAFYYWSSYIYDFEYPIIIVAVLTLVSYIAAYILEKLEELLSRIWKYNIYENTP